MRLQELFISGIEMYAFPGNWRDREQAAPGARSAREKLRAPGAMP